LERSEPSAPVKKNIRSRCYVALHSDFASKAMHTLDPSAFDCGDERRMRIENPVRADLSAQAQRFAVCWQQQFDGRSIKPNAVIQASHTMPLINSADHQHGHQYLNIGNRSRIACE
jgi:hypothetical protein